jgi:2-succinyl-5-enolpyruvyl-6-hydroxy-3-cyclohexene-1-carboxylate synthase
MNVRFAQSCISRLLAGLLARSGVTDVVVSPGSRSTPYLSAILERPCLQVHVVIDERSAAFVALGLARATNRPVALLCTSGTAAANYLPAIVEARLTETPLIVLTADRPMSLQGCSAPQTIDQTRIYGSHVVGSTSLVVPNGSRTEYVRLRRQILSMLALAESPEPGPVHINLHTPKPLELVAAGDDDERAMQSLIAQLIVETRPFVPPNFARQDENGLRRLLALVKEDPHGLITCGFDPGRPSLDPLILGRFARTTGYPVLLDAAHPLRFAMPEELRPHVVAPFEPLLRIAEWQRKQAPKIVVQIGRPLTSSTFERWLGSDDAPGGVERILVLTRRGWPDPTGRAELLVRGDLNEALAWVSKELEQDPSPRGDWATRWFDAAAIAADCAIAFPEAARASSARLGELEAIATTLKAQPAGARLVVGNSLPVRELDLLATAGSPRVQAEALRGASGIDGVVSVAVGFALANDRPTTLLIGDISFLHDVGGLWSSRAVKAALAIVVINNGGGRIFEQLPVARAVPEAQMAFWTTPQGLDLSSAARLYGLEYVRAESAGALTNAIVVAHGRPGATVIEVPVESGSAARQSREFVGMVEARLVHGEHRPHSQVDHSDQ